MGLKKIAIVAPARGIDPALAEAVQKLNAETFGADAQQGAPELVFHPQCFLSEGHFAGPDAARAAAFLEAANDPTVDAVWFARGGYGAGRLPEATFQSLTPAAAAKTYLGYSDMGFLLGRLQRAGVGRPAHGPMPFDLMREGGAAAVARALKWLTSGDADAFDASPRPTAPVLAFNITVLAHAIATPWRPRLAGRVLMLEEVGEHLYAMDRALFAIMTSVEAAALAGVMLGRVSETPENDPAFGQTPEEIVRHWCDRVGVPFLGAADIGHDIDNKIVPFE